MVKFLVFCLLSLSAFAQVSECPADASNTFASAVTCAASSGYIHSYTSLRTYLLTANTTIPVGVTLRMDNGAILNCNGNTLTINGPFVADATQHFTNCTSSTLVFGPRSVSTGYFEWFGAKADNSTESGPGINLGLSVLPPNTRVQMFGGCYLDSATPLSYNTNLIIVGTGMPANPGACTTQPFGSSIIWTGGASNILTVSASVGTPHTGRLQDVGIINNGTATSGILVSCRTCQQIFDNVGVYAHAAFGTSGIQFDTTLPTQTLVEFRGVQVRSDDTTNHQCPIGIDVRGGVSIQISHSYISDCDIGIRLGVTTDANAVSNVSIDGATRIETNTVSGCCSPAIDIDVQFVRGLTVSGVWLESDLAAGRMIRFNQANGYLVAGNYVVTTAGATRAYVFQSDSSSGGLFTGNTYTSMGTNDQYGNWDVTGVNPEFDIGREDFHNQASTERLRRTLVANSATPNVSSGNMFVTANTQATTITNFNTNDGQGGTTHGQTGKDFTLVINDANTTLGCNTGGNIGCASGVVDRPLSSGQAVHCWEGGPTNRYWYCD